MTEVLQIVYYTKVDGHAPFIRWFESLRDRTAKARIVIALERIAAGNLSNVKRIGPIFEYRMQYGPGYRLYFGMDDDRIVVLLTGGTKQRQGSDIETANRLWADLRAENRNGEI